MYRYGEARRLKFMLPLDNLRLGWPGPFPGEYHSKTEQGILTEMTDESFSIVAHHAVLNSKTMLRAVPGATFVTILRNPGDARAWDD